jgi:cytoskeletal protein CcmA (bactofilin family)
MRALHLRAVRAVLAMLAAAPIVMLAAAPAHAGVGPGGGRLHDRRIGVGDTTVAGGTSVRGPLIAIDGTARVAGRVDGAAVVIRGDVVVPQGGVVDGNVVVIRGDANVDGTVRGDVTVVRGRAVVGSGAVVRGDVRSSESPRVAQDARVTGDVEHLDLGNIIAAIGAGILVYWWIAVTVSTLILGLIMVAAFPRALDAAIETGRDRATWWQALLIGFGLVVGLPIVAVLALISLVGLPLGLGVLGALGLLHAVGYVTSAYFLGRLIIRPPKSRFGAFFVGWAILRVAAVLPFLGALVWIAAAIYGVGMLAHAAFRAGRTATVPEPQPA